MRRKVLAGVAAAVATTVMAAGAPAFGAATVTPNSNLNNGDLVNVNFSGFQPNEVVFINECWVAQDNPAFDPNSSCSPANGINPSANASGSGTTQFQIWAGADPNIGESACGFSAPGATLVTTCYIRVAPGDFFGTSRDESYPITFATGPAVPEAPYTVLLPLGALAVLGGAYFVVRNRKAAAA
jgi:hypothetical protein